MSEVLDVIRKAKSTMAVAITGGQKVERRKALVRKATPAEEMVCGAKGFYMVDRCPGCGDPVPVVGIRFPTPSYLIAEHTIMIGEGEEAVCGYGGESLEFQTALPE